MADDEEEKQDEPVNASLDAGDEGSDAGEDEEQEEGGGLDAKKILLFVVIPLFILGGVGAGLYFTGTLDKLMAKNEDQGHEEAGHGKKADKGEKHAAPGAHFIEIPNMTVNLSTPGSQPRYLSLTVQLELKSMEDVHAVESVMPRIVDQFQTYLRELRVKDLRGSQGIYRLQMELLARVNDAAYPVEVEDVLFQEILIQ